MRYRWFESISLQQRVYELSVPERRTPNETMEELVTVLRLTGSAPVSDTLDSGIARGQRPRLA
jgi:hypothetical protein